MKFKIKYELERRMEVAVLDKFRLEGKKAIVTGGGRGLGYAMAMALAEVGADIVIADIDLVGAERSAAEIRNLGRRSLAVQMDVTNLKEIQQMVEKAINEFERIDLLINNAGIPAERRPAEEISEAGWNRVLGVNLTGVFLCAQMVGKQMIKQRGGNIINIASMSGMIVNKGRYVTDYCTSKAGVIMLTKALAVEWAKYNIRVNAIAPGYFKTPLIEKILEDPKIYQDFVSMTPLGRIGEPHELGGVAVFLASDASSFITGHTLFVDGGYTCW